MRSGALYFDNNPDRSLADKVRGAAKQYKEAYGEQPTTCFVNPLMMALGTSSMKVEGVDVYITNSVLLNHLWVGVVNESQANLPS